MKRRFYLCHARCIWWRRPASSKSRVRRPWGCLRWSSCLPRCGLSRLATCRNLARWRCRPGRGSEISKLYEHDYKSNQGILTNIHAPVINITYTIFLVSTFAESPPCTTLPFPDFSNMSWVHLESDALPFLSRWGYLLWFCQDRW